MNLWILSFHKKVSPGCRGGEPPCKTNKFAETLVLGKTQNIFTAPKQNQILKESVIHSLFSFLVKLDIERVSQMC